MEKPRRLIDMEEVCALTSLSRTQIDRQCMDGNFPERVYLNRNRTRFAFVESEVAAWIEARVAERTQPVAA